MKGERTEAKHAEAKVRSTAISLALDSLHRQVSYKVQRRVIEHFGRNNRTTHAVLTVLAQLDESKRKE